jgi:phospholipid/cholesterol/gamma-HCH transport system permease protein
MIFIENLGKSFISLISAVGRLILFITLFFKYFSKPKFYLKINFKYFINILISSIPIIALTGIFSGMVLALQSYTGFSRFSAESAIPNIVVLTLTRELGPVLTGLMISARVGSSIAAEIATMRVTEQIDALKTLNTNYYNYLVTPRVLALTLAMPILVTLVDFIGVMGGYLVSIYKLGFNENLYLMNTLNFLSLSDYLSGIFKALTFGFIISIVSCYSGLYSGKGAFGVGSATTNSVVISSILILFSNYILTEIFF